MLRRRFSQLDVFSDQPTRGNALAVVIDGDGLTDDQMAAFARWTNLSETTFIVPPTDPDADYAVRIWTVGGELPFAGHPTLGTCRAWLDAGGVPQTPGVVVQECGIGLVRVRMDGDRLAFAAPDLIASGPIDPSELEAVIHALGLDPDDVLDSQWVDNGPGWMGLRLRDAETVLAAHLNTTHPVRVTVIGEHTSDSRPVPDSDQEPVIDYEVRAFFGDHTGTFEDPVTGSANAGLASWLIEKDVLPPTYVARQGTAIGRDGRIFVQQDGDDIWIGGNTVELVAGTVTI